MNKTEKKLLAVLADLDKDDRNSLLSFADFLLEKAKKEGRIVRRNVERNLEPVLIPRPADERVVAAIKRLSATFPMLHKDSMINETASLMTEHLIHGRSAVDVIDELELLFQNRYKEFCKQKVNDNTADDE